MLKLKDIYQKKDELKSTLLWLNEQSRSVRKYVWVFLLISFLSMLFSLASPVASKYVVDSAISTNTGLQPKYIAVMLATTLFSILLSYFSNLFGSYVNEKFSFEIRSKMFDRTQRGEWKKITEFHSGDMLSRLTGDVDTVASNIVSILPALIIASLQLAIILVILFVTDPVLALVGLVIGPVGVALSLVFRRPFQKYQMEIRNTQSEYYTFFQESLGNLDVIKSFQLEDGNNSYFNSFRKRRMKTVMKSTRLSSMMSSIIQLVYGIGYVIAFCWCAYKINSTPEYTYGTMTMFLSLVTQLQGCISGIGNIVPKFYSTIISAKRIRDITEQNLETVTKNKEYPQKIGLCAENVEFSYNDDIILRGVNLNIEPFERVGIIGASGAGKTTLIRLLLALVKPSSGKISYTLDSKVEEVSPESRRFISYVPQGNTLMTGTVRDNLLIGNPDATEEDMKIALQCADVYELVYSNPEGLNMKIKEHSGGISAGQAQRICIARALMRKRPVVILDEATSALDEKTEQRVFETISASCEQTCFIITHRSSMLRYCTSVIEVKEDGSVEFRKLKNNVC